MIRVTRRRALGALAVVALVSLYGARRHHLRARWEADEAKIAAQSALVAGVTDARGALELLRVDREVRRAPDADLGAIHRIAPPPQRRLADLPAGPKHVQILKSGDIAVIGATTRVYDLMTGAALGAREAPAADDVPAPNPHFEAVPAGDDALIVDLGRRQHVVRLAGHTAAVTLTSIAGWRPAGHVFVATASADRTVRVWQEDRRDALVILPVETAPAFLWLASDATRLVTADAAAEDVRVYDVTLDAAVKELCVRAKNEPVAKELCP